MKIVIDIPNSTFTDLKKKQNRTEVDIAVLNGTPIPKGHGNLKDEIDLDLFAPSLGTDEYVDDLMAKHNIDYVNGDDEDKVRAFAMDLIHSCNNVIETAPTIVDADKAESK